MVLGDWYFKENLNKRRVVISPVDLPVDLIDI